MINEAKEKVDAQMSEFLHKFATAVQIIRNMKIREDAAMDLLRQNEGARKTIEPKMNELLELYKQINIELGKEKIT